MNILLTLLSFLVHDLHQENLLLRERNIWWSELQIISWLQVIYTNLEQIEYSGDVWWSMKDLLFWKNDMKELQEDTTQENLPCRRYYAQDYGLPTDHKNSKEYF